MALEVDIKAGTPVRSRKRCAEILKSTRGGGFSETELNFYCKINTDACVNKYEVY